MKTPTWRSALPFLSAVFLSWQVSAAEGGFNGLAVNLGNIYRLSGTATAVMIMRLQMGPNGVQLNVTGGSPGQTELPEAAALHMPAMPLPVPEHRDAVAKQLTGIYPSKLARLLPRAVLAPAVRLVQWAVSDPLVPVDSPTAYEYLIVADAAEPAR